MTILNPPQEKHLYSRKEQLSSGHGYHFTRKSGSYRRRYDNTTLLTRFLLLDWFILHCWCFKKEVTHFYGEDQLFCCIMSIVLLYQYQLLYVNCSVMTYQLCSTSTLQISARGTSEPSRTSAHRTMDTFLRQGQKNLLKSVWEVIQIVPLDTPGLFRLWVSIDGNIQQLKVNGSKISLVSWNCVSERMLRWYFGNLQGVSRLVSKFWKALKI